jgi:ribosomal protein L19
MHRGKTLISHIDSGERKRIEGTRQFEMPNYRSGDVLEVTMFNSLSEGTFNTFTGVIYANKMRKNLRHSFKMNTIVDSVNTSIMFKAHSPMIGKVSLVKYGSN